MMLGQPQQLELGDLDSRRLCSFLSLGCVPVSASLSTRHLHLSDKYVGIWEVSLGKWSMSDLAVAAVCMYTVE